MFRLHSPYQPMGDQPEAIGQLVEGLGRGERQQTLLGATGTGKTFTIEKDASRNQDLDRLRLLATSSLLSREDVIVVSSVSCLYGLGSPDEFRNRMTVVERVLTNDPMMGVFRHADAGYELAQDCASRLGVTIPMR